MLIEFITGVIFSIIILLLVCDVLGNKGYPNGVDVEFQLEVHPDVVYIKFKQKIKFEYLYNGYTESRQDFKNEEEALRWIKNYLTAQYNKKSFVIKDVSIKVKIEK